MNKKANIIIELPQIVQYKTDILLEFQKKTFENKFIQEALRSYKKNITTLFKLSPSELLQKHGKTLSYLIENYGLKYNIAYRYTTAKKEQSRKMNFSLYIKLLEALEYTKGSKKISLFNRDEVRFTKQTALSIDDKTNKLIEEIQKIVENRNVDFSKKMIIENAIIFHIAKNEKVLYNHPDFANKKFLLLLIQIMKNEGLPIGKK